MGVEGGRQPEEEEWTVLRQEFVRTARVSLFVFGAGFVLTACDKAASGGMAPPPKSSEQVAVLVAALTAVSDSLPKFYGSELEVIKRFVVDPDMFEEIQSGFAEEDRVSAEVLVEAMDRLELPGIGEWELERQSVLLSCNEDDRRRCVMDRSVIRIAIGAIEGLEDGRRQVGISTLLMLDGADSAHTLGHFLTLEWLGGSWSVSEYQLISS
ncbi:MAG: hypothetical protein QGD89_10200 [Actinomycetota bacterium]|nr:hypothetical protein [Actinomycetota bacterium]